LNGGTLWPSISRPACSIGPVVVVLMPPQPTEAEFFDRVLEALDAPSAGHWARGPQLRSSVIRLLREVCRLCLSIALGALALH
jgi:hypothetical protein